MSHEPSAYDLAQQALHDRIEALERSTTPQRAADTERRLDAALQRIGQLESAMAALALLEPVDRPVDAPRAIVQAVDGRLDIALRRIEKLESEVKRLKVF